MLGSKVRLETLVLSLGQSWVAALAPPAGLSFTGGTTAQCIITDPAGAVLATWTPIAITPARIDFVVPPAQSDPIPHGSYFRLVVHYAAVGARAAFDDNYARGSVVRDDNPTR
jgi:hypothetical protein